MSPCSLRELVRNNPDYAGLTSFQLGFNFDHSQGDGDTLSSAHSDAEERTETRVQERGKKTVKKRLETWVVSEPIVSSTSTSKILRAPTKAKKGEGRDVVRKPPLTGEMLTLLALNHLYPNSDHERELYPVDHIVAFLSLNFDSFDDPRQDFGSASISRGCGFRVLKTNADPDQNTDLDPKLDF
jgi:hypothetical protein